MDRRSFTRWFSLVLGGSLLGIPAADPEKRFEAMLRHLFAAPDAAEAVGERYLALHEGATDREMLLQHLGIRGESPASARRLAEIIARQRLQDFRDGKLVVVDGWLLARSEAATCALLSLTLRQGWPSVH